MSRLARGAAFIDLDGAVLAADAGFRALLDLPERDGPGALARRAGHDPAWGRFLASRGPAELALSGRGGPVLLQRTPGVGGALLLACDPRDGGSLEPVAGWAGLAHVAAGLEHDMRNVLNAMSLQLALLEGKLGEGEAARAATGHFASVHAQVGKASDLLRRFRGLAAPSQAPAPIDVGLDLGATVGDLSALFGHELRRRRIGLTLEAPAGVTRTSALADRTVRLLLGLLGQALDGTPDGGELAATVCADGALAVVRVTHAAGDPGPDLDYDMSMAAAMARALGGALERTREGGEERVTVRLPRSTTT